MDSVDGESSQISAAVVAELQARITVLAKERDEYKHLAELLQRELERLRDLQKTPREHVDTNQVQLAFAAMAADLLAKLNPPTPPASPAEPSGESSKKRPRKHTPHGRATLPDHLPVETLVINPGELAPGSVLIDEEVSWRLGFRRAGFHRLKIVRPIYVVPKAGQPDASANDQVDVQLHQGDISPLARAVAARKAASEATAVASEAPSAEPSVAEAASDATLESTPAAGCASGPGIGDADAPSGPNGSGATTTVVCAAPPDEVIPRGLPTPDLLAHILTNKFADQLPFNRQEGILARHGVHITRGVMCNWAERSHAMAKLLVSAMCDDALAHARYILADATGTLVQANEKCKKGHFWVQVAERDHVIFRYSAKHSKEQPLSFFKDFRGILLVDASSVYDALFDLPDGPTEGGCNSHARRYFFKALTSDQPRALVAIGFFNRLFELEREFAKLSPDERLRRRQTESAPVVELLRKWRLEQLAMPDVAEGSPIRRALNYLGNHWEALTRFLSDGHIPIHNNLSELQLRRLVVGRANWLFVGSDDTAAWTCTFVSLIASAQLHGLDPEAYLRDLFRILPLWPQTRILELAPKYWRDTRARLDAAQLALPLGPITVPPKIQTSSGQQPPEKPEADDGSARPVSHAN